MNDGNQQDNTDTVKIKNIKLTNFQAHAERLVKFVPGITTIKGATDQGKSSILRALGWCCLNDIPGGEFIKDGEKKTSVVITTDSIDDFDRTIERARSSSGVFNTYQMDEHTFKAFGLGVPDDIATHLSLSLINFQSQHDSPFWFSLSAPEVSRQLNAVIDLSVIDSSLGYMAGQVRIGQAKVSLSEERLQKVTAELAEIKPQQERIEEFEHLEELKITHDNLNEKVTELGNLIAEIRDNKAKEYRARETAASEVYALGGAARELTNQTTELQNLITQATAAKRNAVGPPDDTELKNAQKEWFETGKQCDELEEMIRELEGMEDRVQRSILYLQKKEKQYHETTKGENCPLCGNLIE